jgi:Asp-tRNA(Asn)/Glu-tRNA(Gln) amidotransferase A subunit family amidase
MTEITSLSLAELCRRVSSGELAADEVVRAHAERAAAHGPALNAFTELTGEGARDSGPLKGIPVGVKDAFVDGDRVPTMGSRVQPTWMSGTADVLRRLRAMGATVLGYTNLHEWAIATTSTVTASGPVKNPWDVHRMAGGSSGGSAAAVAAGLVPVAIGTDAGGSIRVPAACCGVVGFKATFGELPLDGESAAASSVNSMGLLARSVTDVELLFALLTGRTISEVEPVRLGVASSFFFDDVQDGVRAAVDAAVSSLRGTMDVVAVPMDGVEVAGDVVAREHLSLVAELLEDDIQNRSGEFDPSTLRSLRFGLERRTQPPADAKLVHAAWARAFDACDVVVTPTLPALPPPLDQAKVDVPSGSKPMDRLQIALNAPMNVAGIPALSLPCGELEGLPVGVTLSAQRGAEDVLFSVGRALEERLGGAYSGRVAPYPAR